ncbi:efflux RND transporter periplasmic adaptor subunit [uncultured Desulfosarcina sp.]|uniref:efflux RND transporter periplasmic adaptor subunit n=1 Tax=uncultured Desulfosarcina sp. TaxID=218289 RepID=UPI0029C6E752|nr:efflux RND transporter periplasmic adaptor subunit [uncultured Desulfosarcina sp.]
MQASQPTTMKKWIIINACALLAMIGCQGENQQQAQAPAAAAPAPQVSVVTIQPQVIMLTTELPGRTSAYRIAEIRPQVNGLIQKRLFTEGADVKAGDILYQIDPATFKAALGNAEAALGRSEATLPAIRSRVERYKELLAENAVSQQDYDDAAAELKNAEADIQYWQASVETARINLNYTRITAPISGRIGKSNVTEGAIVTAYQAMALTSIQQLDPIYVDVPQSTTDLLRLRKRLKEGHLDQSGKSQNQVALLLEDGSTYPYEGSLKFRDVSVEQSTGSVTLRVVFPNPDGLLLPGMFVRAVIKEGENQAAILVPQQGVSRDRRGNPQALIVDAEGKTALRMLTVDRAIGDQWLVTEGLAPGDRVIVEGLKMLRPGTPVQAVPFTASNAAPAGGTK